MTDKPKIDPIYPTAPAHKSIASALAAAQAEMGRAKKSAKNPHFKSKYADLDSVCDAAMGALTRHGIAVIQPLERDGDQWVLITRFMHGDSGESVETPMPLIMGKNDMQGLGSAQTYARRYGLMTLAMIAPEDDDGHAAAESVRYAPPPPRQDPPKPKTQQPDEAEIAKNIIEDVDAARGDKAELTRLWGNYKSVMAGMSDDNFDAVKKAFEAAAPKGDTKTTDTAAMNQQQVPNAADDAISHDEIPF